ncbi:MAG: DUF3311 domain-containing protein [Sporichthyaceae bacterium]
MTTHQPDRPEERRNGVPGSTARAERSDHHPINWLLLLPLVITLFPPVYNSIDPTLLDVPFFYWYQMAAILVSVVITLLVYRKTRV